MKHTQLTSACGASYGDPMTNTTLRPYTRPPTLTPATGDLTWVEEGTLVPRGLQLTRDTLTLTCWHPVNGVRVREFNEWRTAVHQATNMLRSWADEMHAGEPLPDLIIAILRTVATEWETAHVYRRALGSAIRAAFTAGVIGNSRSPGVVTGAGVARMLGCSATQVEKIIRNDARSFSN